MSSIVLIKAGLYSIAGAGVTGSSDMKCKVRRDSDGQFFDFDDSTFKAAGWTTLENTMAEADATNIPGEYVQSLDVSIAAWVDGAYTAYVDFEGTLPWTDFVEFSVFNNVESIGDIVTNIFNEIIDGTIDFREAIEILMALMSAGSSAQAAGVFTYNDQDGALKVTQTITDASVTTVIEP